MAQSLTQRTAETENYKLRFLLKQKALPEDFHLKGEGFGESTLSSVTVHAVTKNSGEEMLLVHFPRQIGRKSLERSGLKLAGLFRSRSSSGDYIVHASYFKILADKDLAGPLEDLANTPFYLASIVQKETSGVKKLPSCLDKGEMVKVLSISGDNAIIKLRDDLAPTALSLYGLKDLAARKRDEFGSAYSVPVKTLVEGSEKALERLKLQDDNKKKLGLLACKIIGKNISVITYNMICDGVIGVGVDTKDKDDEAFKKFTDVLKSTHVHFDQFNLGEKYV